MHFTGLSIIFALSAAAVASPKSLHRAGQSPAYLLARSPTKFLYKGSSDSHLMARQSSGSAGGSDTCYGEDATCESCFGSGYTECPDDDLYCYDPSDPSTSCPGDSGSSGGSAGGSDTCYGADATCESCFGSGYTECPGDDLYCYDPSDPSTSCPDDSGSSGDGSSGDGSSSASASDTGIGSIATSTSAASETTGLGTIGNSGGSSEPSSTVSDTVTSATHSSSSSSSSSSSPTETSSSSSSGSHDASAASGIFIPLRFSVGVIAAVLVAIALM